MEPISHNVRYFRKLRGMTQAELAKAAGTTQYTVSEIELGHREPHPATLRKLATALGIRVADFYGEAQIPKVSAPPSPTQPPLNGFEEERRAQEDLGRDLGRLEGLWGWKSYLSRRVEWCESVLQKSQEERFLNPFLSLDTAIQWAMYVGIESTQLRDALRTEIRSYTDADSEIVGEIRTLLDRFVAVDDATNARVKAMMDEAREQEEQVNQRREQMREVTRRIERERRTA